ncbi:MAG: helix-turn-helix transcriptional regulator [Candidatus Omnitrophica bacterium]|nr:helix-turn-helix transcriptional regulator [Candidatus Omnitrophota bacterium]
MADRYFGTYLKKIRLEKGFGLRRFATLVGMLPSNLCHIETGRQSPPQDINWAKKVLHVLGIKEGSGEWDKFFELQAKRGEIPADVKQYLIQKNALDIVPLMARTIKNKKLTRKEIEKLIDDIQKM